MILAIDTATEYAGLALYEQDGLFAEESWRAGRNHTVELMPRLVRLLKLAGLEVAQLEGLAVSLGPGSFTGLRIGLAVAKGLALPHKLPLVGVPTLEVMAYPLRHMGLPVWTIVQAGRRRILAACYARTEEQSWHCLQEPQLTTFESLAPQIDRAALCTGEFTAEEGQILRRGSGHKARLGAPAERLRRAGYLAEIGAARLAAGQVDAPDTLAPFYTSSL